MLGLTFQMTFRIGPLHELRSHSRTRVRYIFRLTLSLSWYEIVNVADVDLLSLSFYKVLYSLLQLLAGHVDLDQVFVNGFNTQWQQ